MNLTSIEIRTFVYLSKKVVRWEGNGVMARCGNYKSDVREIA